jgi:hypothetical protein
MIINWEIFRKQTKKLTQTSQHPTVKHLSFSANVSNNERLRGRRYSPHDSINNQENVEPFNCWLVVYRLTAHLRIYHSYGDIAIVGDWPMIGVRSVWAGRSHCRATLAMTQDLWAGRSHCRATPAMTQDLWAGRSHCRATHAVTRDLWAGKNHCRATPAMTLTLEQGEVIVVPHLLWHRTSEQGEVIVVPHLLWHRASGFRSRVMDWRMNVKVAS